MTLVKLPYRSQLQAGQPEDIGMVLADMDAILAVVNGDLRNDNFSSSAGLDIGKLGVTGVRDGTKYLRDDATWQPLVPGDFLMIADSNLAAAAASINFASIPQTFRTLQLVCQFRTAQAAVNDGVWFRFNGDSGSNYDSYNFRGVGTTPTNTGVEDIATNYAKMSLVAAGNTAPANVFGIVVLTIPFYANTTGNKIVEGVCAVKWGTATGNLQISHFQGNWRSNAAINQITFTAAGGANFSIGTRVTLYGC
jgi:hypothetical protein